MASATAVMAIEKGKIYPLSEFKKITGWGEQALRDARASGLRVVYHSRSGVIAGDDFHAWIMDPQRRTEHYSVTSQEEN